MSHNSHNIPKPPEKRIVILPEDIAPNDFNKSRKPRFNFTAPEQAPELVPALNAFNPDLLDKRAAENFSVHDHLKGAAGNNEGSSVAYKSASQNVYALLERGDDAPKTPEALQRAYAALDEFWSEIDTHGIAVDKDNVKHCMSLAIEHVKQTFVAAGDETGAQFSAGMTMVKMFEQDGGWGAAIAHVGNTTHCFITSTEKSAQQVVRNEENEPGGRVMEWTQSEFSAKSSTESSLNSDRSRNPHDTSIIDVIPNIPTDSKIVLCNDPVLYRGRKKSYKQSSSEREKAILHSGSNDAIDDTKTDERIAEKLIGEGNAAASVLIIDLKERVKVDHPKRLRGGNTRPTPVTAPPTPPIPSVKVAPLLKAARIAKEFLTSDDPEIRRRRHLVEAVGAVALAGAAIYVGKHRFPEQTEELVNRVTRSKVVKKAGALAVKAGERSKEVAKNSKSAQRIVAYGTKQAPKIVEKVQASRDKVKPAVLKATETVQQAVESIAPAAIAVEPTNEAVAKRAARLKRAKATAAAVKAQSQKLRAKLPAKK